jgi:hypothetical protein
MKIFGLILALVILVSGCVMPNTVPSEVNSQVANPLICEGKDQCDLYWQRAMFYVNNNSRYKVQNANENLIQTYSPTGGSTYLGYNISREPLGNGRFRIWARVWCDNMFGCEPAIYPEVAKIKRYIASGN